MEVIIGTIVGACIAGAFMYFKDKNQMEFERLKSKKELLLDKYEHIYKDLNAYSAFSNEISMQMISETGYGGKFDIKKLSISLSDNQLIMDVMFYAPELQNIMNKVHQKQEDVTKSVTTFILDTEATKEHREKLTGDAFIASAELSKLVKEAQKKLAGLVKAQLNA